MKKIVQFLNSIYFIILVNIIAVVCWYLKNPFIAYMIYLVFCILIILVKANHSAIASLILGSIISYRVGDETTIALHSYYAKIFIPLGLVVLVLFVFDIIRRKKRFKLSLIFFGFLSLLIANILSFINIRGEERTYLALLGILQLFAFFVMYLYLLNTQDPDGKKYISNVALIVATAISIELAISYITVDGIPTKVDNDLFWAVSNTIAMFYLVLIPIGVYNYFKNQKYYYSLLLTGFNFCLAFFMLSRGAYLSIAILIIPAIVLVFMMAKEKRRLLIDLASTGVICLIVTCTFGVKFGLIDMLIEYFRDLEFFNDNGREELLLRGWQIFKAYPILGSGSYTGAFYLKDFNLGTYHNYIIQTIATTGIVGLVSLVYFVYSIVKSSLKKDCYNLLFLISIMYILIHGLVDNSFYNPIIMMFLAVTMPFLEQYHENLESFELK